MALIVCLPHHTILLPQPSDLLTGCRFPLFFTTWKSSFVDTTEHRKRSPRRRRGSNGRLGLPRRHRHRPASSKGEEKSPRLWVHVLSSVLPRREAQVAMAAPQSNTTLVGSGRRRSQHRRRRSPLPPWLLAAEAIRLALVASTTHVCSNGVRRL